MVGAGGGGGSGKGRGGRTDAGVTSSLSGKPAGQVRAEMGPFKQALQATSATATREMNQPKRP